MNNPRVWISLCLAALVVGCTQQTGETSTEPEPAEAEAAEAKQVVANIKSKDDSGVTGKAIFTYEDGHARLHVEIENASPGEHAFHIHETGDCSSDDGSSDGGHWNPTAVDHGKWGGADPFHLGDIGNITVGEDGIGTFDLVTGLWSIGTGEDNDVAGKAVILHEGADDFTSQPTGSAGGRIGCGVIE